MNLSRRGFVGAGAAMFAVPVLGVGWKAPEKNTVRGGFDEVAVAGADVQMGDVVYSEGEHRHCVDVVTALNSTLAGIYAHLSALKGGETMKIPEVCL